jgi:uncharacterized protein YjbI with pentapeptide repeats
MVLTNDSINYDYIVEFIDDEGYTYGLPTVTEEDLELVMTAYEARHWRKPPEGDLVTKLLSHQKWLNTREEEGEQLQLDGANLSNLVLTEYNLANADLPRTNFDGVLLRKADLYGAYLIGSSFRRANLDEARLEKADITNSYLVGTNMRSVRATRADFTDANLRSADFGKANLFRARFTNADLRRAFFCDAVLMGVSFNRADLTDADLTGARLDRTILLSETKGLDAVTADWIDIGTDGAPHILKGDAALKWLLDAHFIQNGNTQMKAAQGSVTDELKLVPTIARL